MSQALLLYPNIQNLSELDTNKLTRGVIYLFKLINPGCLMSYKQTDSLTLIVLYIIFTFVILKYILFAYVLYIAFWNHREYPLLIQLWKWTYRTQGRVLYYLITSFWVQTILSLTADELEVKWVSSQVLTAITGVLIGFEYLLSLLIETQFCYILPTKSFLSSKNFSMQVTTLNQKFIIQVIQIAFSSNRLIGVWIMNILNLICSIFRIIQFYSMLPLYRYKALIYQGYLLGITFSLNLSCFIWILLFRNNSRYEVNISFIMVSATILSLLIVKTSHEVTKGILMKLLTSKKKGTLELLIHKVISTKELKRRQRFSGRLNEKYEWTSLLIAAENANLKAVFSLNLELFADRKLDINDHETANQIFIHYFEELLTKFPDNSLVKLHLAQAYGKKPQHYAKVIKINTELGQSIWSIYSLSSSFMLYKAEKTVLSSHENRKTNLDLSKYIKSRIHIDNLKEEMIDQANLKIKVCENKEKYIMEVDLNIQVHPYINPSLYLNMIIRPVQSKKEYILIRENGEVEGATEALTKRLRLSTEMNSSVSSPISIKLLSKELSEMNEAFNIIQKAQLAEKLEKFEKTESQGQIQERKPKMNDALSTLTNLTRNTISYKNLDEAKALNIHRKFTMEGEKIELRPVSPQLNKSINDISLPFHCHVSILQYEAITMKLLALEEIIINEDQQNHGEIKLHEENIRGCQQTTQKTLKLDTEHSSDSITGSENIKDCQEGNMITESAFRITQKIAMNTNDNFVPPKTFYTTRIEVPFYSARTDSNLLEKDHLTTSNLVNFEVWKKEPTKMRENDLTRRGNNHPESSVNHSHQTRKENDINKLFGKATSAKSYAKSFTLFSLLFYAVILGTLVSQIILKVTSDNTMADLVIKTNALNYAQLRLFYTNNVQINCRGISLEIAGAISTGDLGPTGKSIIGAIPFLMENVFGAAKADKEMRNSVNSLSEEIRQGLFQKDIKITGSYYDSYDQDYIMVTSFQAVEKYVNAMQAFTSLPDPVSTAGFHMNNFVALNTLNDFFAKSSEIIDLFQDSVSKQKDSFLKTVVLCLIVTPFLLAGITIVLSLIILSQYNNEKNNLLAFTKLPSDEIRKISATFKKFRTSLENEESFQEKLLSDTLEGRALLIKMQSSPIKYRKEQGLQTVKYSKIRLRYYAFLIRVIVYITILIGIMIWNFVSAQNITKTIYRRQEQLHFASYVSTRIGADYATTIEIFTSNNTNLVEHHLPLTEALAGLSAIKEIREQIADKFQEVDKSYDLDVKAILFNDFGCDKVSIFTLSYCQYFERNGQPINLISMLATFETLMTQKLTDYYAANRSSYGALIAAGLLHVNDFLPAFVLGVDEAQLLVNIVDKNLKKSISELNYQRILITIVSSLALVTVSVLIWLQILAKLREVNNDIKKVLQVFPPKLILSSFFLKMFLKKTSPSIQFS